MSLVVSGEHRQIGEPVADFHDRESHFLNKKALEWQMGYEFTENLQQKRFPKTFQEIIHQNIHIEIVVIDPRSL